jgi:hypothetical protein
MRHPERLSRALSFVLHCGIEVHPYRMENSTSGKLAFRVSPGGKKGNTLALTHEVDEAEMLARVLEQGWAVRCRSLDGSISSSQYKVGHRAVAEIKRP